MLKADLDLNAANLALSEVDYERKKALFPKHAIAKSELDAAFASLKVNQARVASSKAHLAQTLITAPFSGKLGLRQVNIGDQVGPETTICNSQAIDPVYIDFTIPESEILKVAVGRKVELDDDAYPNTKFIGTVKAIESVINTNAQSITVRAEVPNNKSTLYRVPLCESPCLPVKHKKSSVFHKPPLCTPSMGIMLIGDNNKVVKPK